MPIHTALSSRELSTWSAEKEHKSLYTNITKIYHSAHHFFKERISKSRNLKMLSEKSNLSISKNSGMACMIVHEDVNLGWGEFVIHKTPIPELKEFRGV